MHTDEVENPIVVSVFIRVDLWLFPVAELTLCGLGALCG